MDDGIPDPKKCLICITKSNNETYDSYRICPHYRQDIDNLQEWKNFMKSEIAKSVIGKLKK